MEAEARLIIGLSMNKIMASRTRRGGASLHRNLLVASVLVKARTFYLASAEQRRSASVELETPPANNERVEIHENDDNALSNEIEDMDISVLPEVLPEAQPNDSTSRVELGETETGRGIDISMSSNSNVTTALDAQELVQELEMQLCENMTVTEEQSQYSDLLESVAKDVMGSNNNGSDDVDSEQYKENIAPSESVAASSRRKRGYTEVEYAVISIGGTPEINADGNDNISQDTNEDSNNLGYSNYRNRSNNSFDNSDTSSVGVKRSKLDLVDISTVRNQSSGQRLEINLQVGTGGQLRSGGSCGNPTGSVYDSFASNTNSLRSPPMLIGTV